MRALHRVLPDVVSGPLFCRMVAREKPYHTCLLLLCVTVVCTVLCGVPFFSFRPRALWCEMFCHDCTQVL